ncbi:glyoxalase [Idiomarina tyrosinivorans]|uniref:Glyoxalase n=1 Tax=Idiomarina tyrosinivorans TaxID=1445662 RepID=A0A432ZRB0_9GAMM|nr:VOC family protein [Idiomarina tyrosinivorans]RUO80366.1 glyoxalase [Idiomarina tyrosinivorans]
MAKVLGIGGVFYTANDPEKLGAWYKEVLGVPYQPWGAQFNTADYPQQAYNVWSLFPKDTKYLQPSQQPFMVNFVVDDVDALLDKVEAAGGQRVDQPQQDEFGRFGWFLDPEGNKVELWQPPV